MYAYRCQSLIRLVEDFGTATENHQGGQSPVSYTHLKEVTVMVHSEDDYNAAVDASNILFGNATSEALRKLDEDTLLAVFEGCLLYTS